MNIAVWGGGTVGELLVRRLPTLPFVSRVHWFNRDFQKIKACALDINHGRTLVPTCKGIRPYPASDFASAEQRVRVAEALGDTDVVVLTHGVGVGKGATRSTTYEPNRDIYCSFALPVLKDVAFDGKVLVVSNPVDLLARLVAIETDIPPQQILGLGTLVETARFRYFLQKLIRWSDLHLSRDLWAYAIGTHDENFVPVVRARLGPGLLTDELGKIKAAAREQVIAAAESVKRGSPGTCFPVVEGCVQVLEAIAYDRRSVLTVSSHDPEAENGETLFYSVPCAVGRNGIYKRLDVDDPDGELAACLKKLRRTIKFSAGCS